MSINRNVTLCNYFTSFLMLIEEENIKYFELEYKKRLIESI